MADKTETEGHKALTSATQTAALLVAMARGAGNRPNRSLPGLSSTIGTRWPSRLATQ
jgi:hypothetical protein